MNAQYNSPSNSNTSHTIPVEGTNISVEMADGNFNKSANITNPSSSSDALADTGSITEDATYTEKGFDDRTNTLSYGDRVDTHEYVNRNDVKSYENRADTETYNELTDTKTYGTTANPYRETETFNQIKDQQTLDKTEKATGADTVTEQGTENNSTKTLDRDIMTGRNQNLAELLTGARNYIARSRAWEFLRAQLEPCFFQVYDLEELCYNDDE